MTPTDLCETINNATPLSFQCRPAPREGVLVQTPLLYPDGSAVEVSVIESGGGFVVTNYGEALRWLGMQSVRSSLSRRQNRLVNEVCQTLGVQLNCGRLVLRCDDALELGKAIHMVGQAVVRVSDVWFTIPLSDTTTEARPRARGRRLCKSFWPWFWVFLYVIFGLGAIATFYYEPNGTPSILQILGVLITLISLWATVRVRTSQTGGSRQWMQTFDWMTAIGTMLIATGIYLGVVGELHPALVVVFGLGLMVVWGIVMFTASRILR